MNRSNTGAGRRCLDQAENLRRFRLRDGMWPLAPTRTPFWGYTDGALLDAVEFVSAHPEARGCLAEAVFPTDFTIPAETIVVEAHVSGANISPSVAGQLLACGFAPDGFSQSSPRHHDTHLSLRFDISASAVDRRRELLNITKQSGQFAVGVLSEAGVDGYVEVEVYPLSAARVWVARELSLSGRQACSALVADLIAHLEIIDTAQANPICVKRADLHIRISDESLAQILERAGFNHVITWSGNSIMTLEFERARDALMVERLLTKFFDQWGGASRMTLEYVPAFWRSSFIRDGKQRRGAINSIVASRRGALSSRSSSLGAFDLPD